MGEELMGGPQPKVKSFEIDKRLVYGAWERVRANQGAPGVDAVSIAEFESKERDNLYKLWNRMSAGSYMPAPVRAVEIPKDQGVRVLGVPTVADRIAQTAAAMLLEEKLEPIFHPDSYGYRPGRSAHDALAVTRRRCWKQNWILDLDVRAFFDSVPHDLLLKAVAHHTQERWVLLYIGRWLTAPMQMPDGTVVAREKGTPQGSPISPLLANLFMHYAFDAWMAREFPTVPFERFVDDVIVHCVSQQQAQRVREAIASRLARCGGLQLHPDKTRIVYCKSSKRHGDYQHVSFDFLGYTFKPRPAKASDGSIYTVFTPAISGRSAKRIRQEIRRMRFHLRSDLSFEDIAKMINLKAGPWATYYGRFRPSETVHVLFHIDRYLVRWATRKYKHLRRAPRRAGRTLAAIKKARPGLLAHWRWELRTRLKTARAG
jgi:group II intron reverse transcriptase/maturase